MATRSSRRATAFLGRSHLALASLRRRNARLYEAAARWLLVLGLLQANLLGFAPLTAEATTAATTAHEGWQQRPGLAGQSVRWLSVNPGNPQQVYAAVEGSKRGVYRSSDGGYNWTSLGISSGVDDVTAECDFRGSPVRGTD